jgi:tetratricopeptide (TPR) repeat protein
MVAEPRLERALQILEGKLGWSHVSLLSVLDNLAAVRTQLKRLEQAEQTLRRILQIRESQLGESHPDVASTLDNLATVLFQQGRYPDAEVLFVRSLGIWLGALGAGHGLLANSYDNLAAAQAVQGKHVEAELNYRKSLEIRDYAIAYNLHNVAQALDKQGKPRETDQLYQSSRSILERLPQDSPLLPVMLTHHAAVLRKLKKDVAAAKLELRIRRLAEPKSSDGHEP